MAKINIALVGAGIWARDQHLPAILENQNVSLKAIYSRSRESAQALAAKAQQDVEIYYEDPAMHNNGLDALLARSDVGAIVACLPILVQLNVVKRCLLAGKHVQSEKPIAGDFATASKFNDWYREAKSTGVISENLVWAVAEEYRLMPPFDFMRGEVARLGAVHGFYVQGYLYTPADSPFYETAWRKVPGYMGGFILDGGVHWVAALRHILGEKNRPVEVAAFSRLLKDHLGPVDTLHAIVKTETGVSGTFAYSAGMQWKQGGRMTFEVTCEQGSVAFRLGDGVGLVTVVEEGKSEVVREFDGSLNSRYELGTFVKSIQTGREEKYETPEEALADLEFMQRMLESGDEGGVVKRVFTSSTEVSG